jgi:hypothetical protein
MAWLAEIYAEVRVASGYLELSNGEIVGRPEKNKKCYPIAVVWDVNRPFYERTVAPKLREFGDVTVGFDNHGRGFLMFLSCPMLVSDHIPEWTRLNKDELLSKKYSRRGYDHGDKEWGEILL